MGTHKENTAAPSTQVAEPRFLFWLRWVGVPCVGALLGVGLMALSGWVASLAWAPLQGPFKLLASMDQPLATLLPLGVGVGAGLAFALLWAREVLTVTISNESVALTVMDNTTTLPRADVSAVFLDEKDLVLLDHKTQELARARAEDVEKQNLRNAFQEHGFPWREDGDPHKTHFRRWVPDMPDLPHGANALLMARERALEKKNTEDAAELRDELATLGVVVRNEGQRQYWRLSNHHSEN